MINQQKYEQAREAGRRARQAGKGRDDGASGKARTVNAEQVRELLVYDPDTGIFRNRVSRSARAQAGCVAGYFSAKGYIAIRLDWAAYYAHRLAWLYVYGEWPAAQIDHINGNRADNRIANLRQCSNAENQQNIKLPVTNSSGYLGVVPFRGKWQAAIKLHGKRHHLGTFDTPEAAHAAYLAAKANLHKFQPAARKVAA